MNTIQVPGAIDAGALEIMKYMESFGFPTYIVGGCVRDMLLERIPHDWDITTKATPDEIKEVAQKVGWKVIGHVGESFGVMLLSVHKQVYEVTTFRREVYGEDSHRPLHVEYSMRLEDDLSRRDFTINAMAMDQHGVLYDFYEGEKDLKNKKLRTVGDSCQRFSEDALRLFRACRFLGQLDFMADSSLVEGMPSAFPRVSGLSLERVRTEVNKLLVMSYAARGLDLLVRTGLCNESCRVKENGQYIEIPILPELFHLVDLPQMKKFHRFDGWMHTLAVVNASPKRLVDRWAALLHDVGKGLPDVRRVAGDKITDHGHDTKGAELAHDILTRWRMPHELVRHVVWLVKHHMHFHYFAHHEEANVEKWIRRMAMHKEFASSQEMSTAVREMTDLCKADIVGCGYSTADLSGHESFGQYMMQVASQMPVTTKDLHYTSEVPKVLGKDAAEGMNHLLRRVQSGNLENKASSLLHAAVTFRRRKNAETNNP